MRHFRETWWSHTKTYPRMIQGPSTGIPNGRALWFLVRFSLANLSDLLAYNCYCQVFPFTDQDGTVRQDLRSTHVQHVIKFRQWRVKRPQRQTYKEVPCWARDAHGAKLLIQLTCAYSLCGDYQEIDPDRMDYFAHMDCWKLASSSARISSLDWSRLAIQTRPFETRCWDQVLESDVCRDDPSTPVLASLDPDDSGLFDADTPLANLLSKVRTLSTELQLQIMSLVKDTMFASLLQTKIFVSSVLPRLGPRSTWTILPKSLALRVDLEGCNRSSRLTCQSTYIMGRSYLSNLALGRLEDSTSHIDIADKEIQGVQFALGRFGLRGVRVLYEGGTHSLWLGESTFSWMGTIPCSDLSMLNVIKDVSTPA